MYLILLHKIKARNKVTTGANHKWNMDTFTLHLAAARTLLDITGHTNVWKQIIWQQNIHTCKFTSNVTT